MKSVFIALVFLIFSVSSYGSCIEDDGILKLNQQIIDQEGLEDFPDATPVSSVLEHISFYEEDFSRIWAIDLKKTYLFQDDFKVLLKTVLPKTPSLKVLVLGTVHLDDGIWVNILFPILVQRNFEYLNIHETTYDNKRIQPILAMGKERYPQDWLDLSKKLIFASQSYYSKLKREILWIRDCEQKGLISSDWDKSHQEYYAEYYERIEKSKALHILTGNESEDDLDDFDEIAASSDSDEGPMLESLAKLTLEENVDHV